MNIEIGAYEAKTKLPELLRGVKSGKCYTITHRGEPVAALVPSEEIKEYDASAAVEQMKILMATAPAIKKMAKHVSIKLLIEEGRA